MNNIKAEQGAGLIDILFRFFSAFVHIELVLALRATESGIGVSGYKRQITMLTYTQGSRFIRQREPEQSLCRQQQRMEIPNNMRLIVIERNMISRHLTSKGGYSLTIQVEREVISLVLILIKQERGH